MPSTLFPCFDGLLTGSYCKGEGAEVWPWEGPQSNKEAEESEERRELLIFVRWIRMFLRMDADALGDL